MRGLCRGFAGEICQIPAKSRVLSEFGSKFWRNFGEISRSFARNFGEISCRFSPNFAAPARRLPAIFGAALLSATILGCGARYADAPRPDFSGERAFVVRPSSGGAMNLIVAKSADAYKFYLADAALGTPVAKQTFAQGKFASDAFLPPCDYCGELFVQILGFVTCPKQSGIFRAGKDEFRVEKVDLH